MSLYPQHTAEGSACSCHPVTVRGCSTHVRSAEQKLELMQEGCPARAACICSSLRGLGSHASKQTVFVQPTIAGQTSLPAKSMIRYNTQCRHCTTSCVLHLVYYSMSYMTLCTRLRPDSVHWSLGAGPMHVPASPTYHQQHGGGKAYSCKSATTLYPMFVRSNFHLDDSDQERSFGRCLTSCWGKHDATFSEAPCYST